MWDRTLFAVRRFGLDLGGRLGSWRLSIVLMVLAALYYGFLAIWARSSPPHVVQNIASLVPFWLLYLALLVNTGVCLWRRLPRLRRELSRTPQRGDGEPDWIVELPARTGPGEARETLRGLGYRVASEGPGQLAGLRRRWSPLGTFLFHGAFFVLALGFLLTLLVRQEARVWVAVGEGYEARPEQFLSQTAPRALSLGVPGRPFLVRRILPEFWRDELLFTTLEADLEFPGGRIATTRINRPVWLGGASYVRLAGFGYAPRYEIRDRTGRVLDSAFVKLNVFPPGQRDYFSPPDYPHRFYVEVLPDFAEEAGEAMTRSLNLVSPAVVLRAFRGHLDLGGALLGPEEGFELEGLKLAFPEIRYWGEFSIVRDPGAPVLFVGYLIGMAGLLLKLRGRRSEAEWQAGAGDDGGTLRGWGGPPPRHLPSPLPTEAGGEA